jgi:hypothetical protein
VVVRLRISYPNKALKLPRKPVSGLLDMNLPYKSKLRGNRITGIFRVKRR